VGKRKEETRPTERRTEVKRQKRAKKRVQGGGGLGGGVGTERSAQQGGPNRTDIGDDDVFAGQESKGCLDTLNTDWRSVREGSREILEPERGLEKTPWRHELPAGRAVGTH